MELAEPAVDEDDVGVEFVAFACFAVSAGDDFADGLVVIVGCGFDAVASVFVFEWFSVDEADF